MGLIDILQQYANPAGSPTGDVLGHFDSVANQASRGVLGSGVAAALRSDATPAFGQTIANLFSQSNPQQKAGVINELLQVLGPAGIAAAGGGVLRKILSPPASTGFATGGVAAGGAATGGAATAVSPTQAAQVSPSDVSAIATTAQQHDDSIVDRLGSFYAQHPTLVKTLGVAALGAVMSHMSQNSRI